MGNEKNKRNGWPEILVIVCSIIVAIFMSYWSLSSKMSELNREIGETKIEIGFRFTAMESRFTTIENRLVAIEKGIVYLQFPSPLPSPEPGKPIPIPTPSPEPGKPIPIPTPSPEPSPYQEDESDPRTSPYQSP